MIYDLKKKKHGSFVVVDLLYSLWGTGFDSDTATLDDSLMVTR